jgi:hypothetical protein
MGTLIVYVLTSMAIAISLLSLPMTGSVVTSGTADHTLEKLPRN